VGEFLGSWATEVGDDYVVSRLGKEEEKKTKRKRATCAHGWPLVARPLGLHARAMSGWVTRPVRFFFIFFNFLFYFPASNPLINCLK
jgi:hypothetical protein